MGESSQTQSLRKSEDGQRFLQALRLISIAALSLSVLSVAFDWLSASESYLEDGVCWIYDSAIYGVAAISFGRGASFERVAAFMLSLILAIAGCQGSYDIWSEIVRTAPAHSADAAASASALATGAILEAALLFRFRTSGEPLMTATWLSARNSAAIALAGAAVPALSHASSGDALQIIVDCVDTLLAFQAAFFVAKEAVET